MIYIPGGLGQQDFDVLFLTLNLLFFLNEVYKQTNRLKNC